MTGPLQRPLELALNQRDDLVTLVPLAPLELQQLVDARQHRILLRPVRGSQALGSSD
jgi:hypothetical protein